MVDQTMFQTNVESNGSTATNGQGDNPLQELIGDGKKYANEAAALESIAPAQTHIAKLETELAELRTSVNSGATLQTVLDALKASGTQGENTQTENTAASTTESPDINELVQTALATEKAKDLAHANELAVDVKMKERYGGKVQDVLVAKAAELHMSVVEMQGIAQRSPEAFLAFFPENKQEGDATNINSSVNTEAMANSTQFQPGTKKFYDNLRKTDRKTFMSPRVQTQMMKDAETDPAKYFN